jgi:hypothetical protein
MSKPLPLLPGRPDFPVPALPSPVPGTATTTPSVRKPLKITVPRAPSRTPLPLNVAEIFDNVDAWSIYVPSCGTGTSTSTSIGAELAPPRIPETHLPNPVELTIDYANQSFPLLSSFLPKCDSDDKQSWPTEEKLRSRWSCSTVATLGAGAKTPSSPSVSEKLRFHFGSVVHRVLTCRTGGDLPPSKAHTRCSSEPSATSGAGEDSDCVGVWTESGHEEPNAESCLRRKPLPLELSCGRLRLSRFMIMMILIRVCDDIIDFFSIEDYICIMGSLPQTLYLYFYCIPILELFFTFFPHCTSYGFY